MLLLQCLLKRLLSTEFGGHFLCPMSNSWLPKLLLSTIASKQVFWVAFYWYVRSSRENKPVCPSNRRPEIKWKWWLDKRRKHTHKTYCRARFFLYDFWRMLKLCKMWQPMEVEAISTDKPSDYFLLIFLIAFTGSGWLNRLCAPTTTTNDGQCPRNGYLFLFALRIVFFCHSDLYFC